MRIVALYQWQLLFGIFCVQICAPEIHRAEYEEDDDNHDTDDRSGFLLVRREEMIAIGDWIVRWGGRRRHAISVSLAKILQLCGKGIPSAAL